MIIMGSLRISHTAWSGRLLFAHRCHKTADSFWRKAVALANGFTFGMAGPLFRKQLFRSSRANSIGGAESISVRLRRGQSRHTYASPPHSSSAFARIRISIDDGPVIEDESKAFHFHRTWQKLKGEQIT